MECTITLTGTPLSILEAMRQFSQPIGQTAAVEPQTMIVNAPVSEKSNGRKKAEKQDTTPVETTAVAEASAPVATTEAPATTTVQTTAPAKTITVEDLRAATQVKAQAGHREKIKAIVESFGVKTLSLLQPEQYADFLDQINAL